jgi:hypothetical protein
VEDVGAEVEEEDSVDVVVIAEIAEVVETDIRSSHSTFRVPIPIPIVKIRKHINNFRIIPDLCCTPEINTPPSKSKLFTYNRTTYIRRYSHYHDTPPFMHTFLAAIIFTFPMSMRLVISSGERPIRPARWRQGGTARIDFGEHPGLAGDEFLYSWYVDRGNLV